VGDVLALNGTSKKFVDDVFDCLKKNYPDANYRELVNHMICVTSLVSAQWVIDLKEEDQNSAKQELADMLKINIGIHGSSIKRNTQ
jgi:hypothetical protein